MNDIFDIKPISNEQKEELNTTKRKKFIERFKRVVETNFTDEYHVSAIIFATKSILGELNSAWEAFTPFELNTATILRRNALTRASIEAGEVDEDGQPEKEIEQHIVLGVKDYHSDEKFQELKTEIERLEKQFFGK